MFSVGWVIAVGIEDYGSFTKSVHRLFGAKSLPEPMLAYCRQLDSWEHISVKFESEFYHIHSSKCNWKYRLPKWWPFCPVGLELSVRKRGSSGTRSTYDIQCKGSGYGHVALVAICVTTTPVPYNLVKPCRSYKVRIRKLHTRKLDLQMSHCELTRMGGYREGSFNNCHQTTCPIYIAPGLFVHYHSDRKDTDSLEIVKRLFIYKLSSVIRMYK